MRKFSTCYGPWALVAGASEGLGAAFAVEIARRGLSLLLIARGEVKLAALAQRLRAEHGVEVRTAAIDLGAPDLAARLVALTEGIEVGLAVYNAASSSVGEFVDLPLEAHLAAVDVNCRGPVVVAHTLGAPMARRGRGGIILMSSLAGTQGTPMVASYGATKAFNLVLAEALWDELRARGVDVMACRAGATRTPGYQASKPRSDTGPVMDPAEVVVGALDALGSRPSMVPGAFNRFASFFMGRLMSRRAAVTIMGSATRKMYLP
jgi:short-subunit dehydrogenase